MNLNQVTIYTSNPTETAEFYEKLGLKIVVNSLPRYGRWECPDGVTTLSVHTAENIPENQSVVLYFECEDLDAKVRELKERGLLFEQEPTDQDWAWREAYLRDPASNRICLFYTGENPKNPPWRVK